MFCAPNAKILTEVSEKSYSPKNLFGSLPINLVMEEKSLGEVVEHVRRHASKSEEMEIEGLQEEEWDDIPEHVDIPSASASKTRTAATCAMEEDASIL